VRTAVIPLYLTATGSKAEDSGWSGILAGRSEDESRPARERFFLDFPFHRTEGLPSPGVTASAREKSKF
jgi:hypothetical protein